MTTVDNAPDKTQFDRLSTREWINNSPGIVVINLLPSNQLELYLWRFGQRLSFRPETPEDLWDWCHKFSQDQWEAMLSLGFIPLEERPSAQSPSERRTKVTLTQEDLEDLFK